MLMMLLLLSAYRDSARITSQRGEKERARERKRGAKLRREEEIKGETVRRDSPETRGVMKCWMGLIQGTEKGVEGAGRVAAAVVKALLISPPFLKQIKLSPAARALIRSG